MHRSTTSVRKGWEVRLLPGFGLVGFPVCRGSVLSTSILLSWLPQSRGLSWSGSSGELWRGMWSRRVSTMSCWLSGWFTRTRSFVYLKTSKENKNSKIKNRIRLAANSNQKRHLFSLNLLVLRFSLLFWHLPILFSLNVIDYFHYYK